jgi:flagellar motor switch protein FliM
LVSRITQLFLDELRNAWENIVDLSLAVIRVESNPQLVQIVPPNEVVVLISFELTLGDVRGMINLCIPYNTIERISSKLTANSWVSYGQRATTEQSVAQISKAVSKSLVQMVVDLADTRITTRDLIGLKVNDIITTQKDIHSPLLVTVQGVPKYQAIAGAVKGHKAIRVSETIAPEEIPGDDS